LSSAPVNPSASAPRRTFANSLLLVTAGSPQYRLDAIDLRFWSLHFPSQIHPPKAQLAPTQSLHPTKTNPLCPPAPVAETEILSRQMLFEKAYPPTSANDNAKHGGGLESARPQRTRLLTESSTPWCQAPFRHRYRHLSCSCGSCCYSSLRRTPSTPHILRVDPAICLGHVCRTLRHRRANLDRSVNTLRFPCPHTYMYPVESRP
jgi:hypothetical protein